MRNIIPALAVALAGCGAGQGEIWLLRIPVMDNSDCDFAVEENFSDADPIVGDEPTTDWIYGSESAWSDQLVYVSIIEGRKGTAYLTVGDEIYPGTATKDGYTFEWTGSEESTYSEQYVPNPYTYVEMFLSETFTKITLNKNKDTRGLKGNLQIQEKFTEDFTETDQWQFEQVPEELPVTGQINAWTQQYIEGPGYTNEWETPECDDPECVLVVTSDCAGTVDVTAEWVGYGDEGVYAALEDAEQQAGASL